MCDHWFPRQETKFRKSTGFLFNMTILDLNKDNPLINLSGKQQVNTVVISILLPPKYVAVFDGVLNHVLSAQRAVTMFSLDQSCDRKCKVTASGVDLDIFQNYIFQNMIFLNPSIEIKPTSISRTLFEKKLKLSKAVISLPDRYGFGLIKTFSYQIMRIFSKFC